jgi:hypothetical protein
MSIGRMAMQALKGSGHFLKSNMGSSPGEIALRVLPDFGFAGLAIAQTPGDMGDKLIAGASQAAGGILGGVGAAGAVRKMGGGQAIQNLADMAGSVAGDFGGMAIGDNVTRGKDLLMGGKGQTAWERMGEADQSAYAQDLEKQILAQYGLLPGSREQYAVDPSSGMGVA